MTLMHEHIFVLSPEIMQNYPDAWGDEEKRVADAIARLNELKSRGVDTIVDLTVIGLGRYIPRIARVAAATELNIVVATGVYTYNDVPMYFHFTGPGTELDGPETMTDMFVRDIEEGIADTGVKAAILKCATDEPGVTPGVERVLRAVAQAHRRTGVPISTHTHAGTRRGLEQQRIFAEEGVDLTRVVIGHSGDTTDIDYLEELIGNGSYIGMDRFGLDVFLPFEDRVDTVARMCERGHADKMVLSHDAMCFNDWLPEEMVPVGAAELALPAHSQRRDPRAEGSRRHRRAAHHDAGGQPAQDLREPGRLLTMLRDIRDLTADPEAYAAELRRRWGGLLSYRYVGRTVRVDGPGPARRHRHPSPRHAQRDRRNSARRVGDRLPGGRPHVRPGGGAQPGHPLLPDPRPGPRRPPHRDRVRGVEAGPADGLQPLTDRRCRHGRGGCWR